MKNVKPKPKPRPKPGMCSGCKRPMKNCKC